MTVQNTKIVRITSVKVLGQEIPTLLRGIQSLKGELKKTDTLVEHVEVKRRIENLQVCLFSTLWPIYGTRASDATKRTADNYHHLRK